VEEANGSLRRGSGRSGERAAVATGTERRFRAVRGRGGEATSGLAKRRTGVVRRGATAEASSSRTSGREWVEERYLMRGRGALPPTALADPEPPASHNTVQTS
jgi:hypothetical protein